MQLYVSKTNSIVERAEKELKAFKKIKIEPGETATVTLKIPVKDLAYYNITTSKWVVEPGKYELHAGKSSRNIVESSTVTID